MSLTDILLISLIILVVIAIVLIIILLSKKSDYDILQFQGKFEGKFDAIEKLQEKSDRGLREEVSKNRFELSNNLRTNRDELNNALNSFMDSVLSQMTRISTLQKNQLDVFATQLDKLTKTNEEKLDKMRGTVEGKLKEIQNDNDKKLDEMRATVDEKLHATLEKRLGESFKIVSDRLEQVYKGLGEMQTLATGVGDLKRVLTNVKTRGIWGEIELGNILEQILTKDQYDTNAITKKGSSERVEFAIKLPGRESDNSKFIYMPIDSKFPVEDYQRLLDAQDNADKELADKAIKQLEKRIKDSAKDIRDKYIDAPNTTDFGIMFLPTEGLYAEVLRIPGLCELLQRDYHILVTGPTTISALLNSLQIGFRTLAIEKRSSEVWKLLGAVKTEFGKFGDVLEKVKKKLDEASNNIDQASVRTRAIERKLKKVEELPEDDSQKLLDEVEELG